MIRSDERLDYDRVDRIFAGRERGGDPWGEPLAAARAAAAALGARRRGAGGGGDRLAPSPSSASIATATWSQPTPVAQTESHRLIEHLMIAANEQVARLLEPRRIPTLYRVHERPEAPAVAAAGRAAGLARRAHAAGPARAI